MTTANQLISGVRLRIQLLSAAGGLSSSDTVLLDRELVDFRVNQEILLGPALANLRYMGPVKVRIQVLDGDPTLLNDANITIRYRRGA